MAKIFQNKHFLLGVTGSIAAYKAAEIASKLTQEGSQVDVVLTQSAERFITPLTFQSLTGRRCYRDEDLWSSEGHVLHIGLARNANLMVIAPATANTIVRLAQGLADNLLCLSALAAQCPLILAPAMDAGMFSHVAVQSSLETLRQRGVTILGPAEGHLASGLTGIGRMVEPVEVIGQIRLMLGKNGVLKLRKFVITAGGTHEPIDPVRFIANRSSGKQGFALAQSALDRGAQVTLISAPTHLPPPIGAKLVRVETAAEMLSQVIQECADADVLIMAAAVADFTPERSAVQKIKREAGIPHLSLRPTTDILREVSKLRSEVGHPYITVGFAAESQDLLENAKEKLSSKNLDLIVVNDITAPDAGFGVDTNRVTILDAGGDIEDLPTMSKIDVAEHIIERVIDLLRTN